MTEMLQVKNIDDDRSVRIGQRDARLAPTFRQTGIDFDRAITEPDAVNDKLPRPSGRAGIPGLVTFPDHAAGSGNVTGYGIRFACIKPCIVQGPGPVDRVDDVEDLQSRLAVANAGICHTEPCGGMGILAAVFARARRIGLDITGIARRFLERGIEGTLARHFLMRGLPEFMVRYPGIEIAMSERDRWVDPVQEGVDCVLRYGALSDSDLVARRAAVLGRVTCSTPGYLARYGTPTSIQDLVNHRLVGIRRLSTGDLTPVEFQVGSELRRVEMKAPFSVTGPESYLHGVQLGLGLAQVPRFHIERDLASRSLVFLLKDTPPPSAPVSRLYPRSRQLSPRVRVFLDWAMREFSKLNRRGGRNLD